MIDITTLDREGLELEMLREDIRTKQAQTALLKAQKRQTIAVAYLSERQLQ